MRSRRKRTRLALMSAVALLTIGFGVVAYQKDLFKWLELRTLDTRFEVRGDQPVPKGVAVVAIDARTFSERPNDRWPFLRRRHAKAIQILKEAGAKVIVYDVQFTERSNPGLLRSVNWTS